MRAVAARRPVAVALVALMAGLAAVAGVPQASLAAPLVPMAGTAAISGTCALDHGRAYCWGGNSDGQLGDGSTGGSSGVPVAVDTSGVLAGKTLTQISASGFTTCALSSAGAAYCWGEGGQGQLGDSGITDSHVPVPVSTSGVLAGKTLSQVSAAGDLASCAVDVAGEAYCWGWNAAGTLGDGSTVSRSDIPVATGLRAPTGVTAMSQGPAAAVSWRAPSSFGGGTLTGYTATAAPGGHSCTAASATSCTIAGLTINNTYSITVTVHTRAGDSGTSTPITVIIAVAHTGPVVSGLSAAKCMSDTGGSTANDTPVVISTCTGSPGQTWAIRTDGTIQYAGKCLDIYRQEKTNGAPVELWTCTGGTNQQWQALNGTLVNPHSGKCLDDPASSLTDGTKLDISTCTGGASQQGKPS
jgi:hypothetical protein